MSPDMAASAASLALSTASAAFSAVCAVRCSRARRALTGSPQASQDTGAGRAAVRAARERAADEALMREADAALAASYAGDAASLSAARRAASDGW